MKPPEKLSRAIQIFLNAKKKPTRESYEYVLRDMLRFIGDKQLKRVGYEHISEYLVELDRRNYSSNATWNKYVKTCRVFFNWCVKRKWIEESPASIMPLRRAEQKVPKERAMPDEDLQKILNYTQFRPRDHALILFLADTGCRAGGAAGLRLQDIDWEMREALVTEKGDKTRRVRFGELCRSALSQWVAKRKGKRGDYVFSPSGEKLQARSISQAVRRACRAVGVTPRGSHSLRHRKGHQLADAKVPPSVAKTALGHSDASITMKHYYPDDWDRASKALDGLSVHSEREDEKIVRFPGDEKTS